jgi:outer membrane receptor protein involved in Fe transport
MLADTHTFTPTLINDLRLSYTRGRFSDTLDPRWDPATGANLNAELGLPSLTKGGLPYLSGLFPGSSPTGSSTATGLGRTVTTQAENREERFALTDIVYKNHGNMSLTFGVDVSHARQNVIPLYGAFGGIYAFGPSQTNSTGAASCTGGSSWASFMLGLVSGNVTARNVQVPYYYRWNSFAAFVRDDWKVTPRLTLNLGLRYALQMPRKEKSTTRACSAPISRNRSRWPRR